MAEVRYHKGQKVKFTFGTTLVKGIIKEDRGPIGIKGRRLYLIEFPFGDDSLGPMSVELPAVDFQLAQHKANAK